MPHVPPAAPQYYAARRHPVVGALAAKARRAPACTRALRDSRPLGGAPVACTRGAGPVARGAVVHHVAAMHAPLLGAAGTPVLSTTT